MSDYMVLFAGAAGQLWVVANYTDKTQATARLVPKLSPAPNEIIFLLGHREEPGNEAKLDHSCWRKDPAGLQF